MKELKYLLKVVRKKSLIYFLFIFFVCIVSGQDAKGYYYPIGLVNSTVSLYTGVNHFHFGSPLFGFNPVTIQNPVIALIPSITYTLPTSTVIFSNNTSQDLYSGEVYYFQSKTISEVNLRKEPKIDPNNVISVLPNGTILTLLSTAYNDQQQLWNKVSVLIGGEYLEGWCEDGSISPLDMGIVSGGDYNDFSGGGYNDLSLVAQRYEFPIDAKLGETNKAIRLKASATPTAYDYISYPSQGITLHMIKTNPDNIDFKNLNGKQSLSGSGYYGINGGYFYGISPCNIAVKNGVSIRSSNGYDTTNKDLVPKEQWKGTGTIIWDGDYDWNNINMKRSKGRFFYLVVQRVDEGNGVFYDSKNTKKHTVTSKKNYWAQGGISMGLNNKNWYTQAVNYEGLVGPTRITYRTGIVYDNLNKKVYLIVTNNSCTVATFRQAIIGYINSQNLKINEMEGIFLDGSGSSQLKCKEKTLSGDVRCLVQIISLINK